MSFHRFLASYEKLDEYDNTGKENLTLEEAISRGYSANELSKNLLNNSVVIAYEDESKMYNLQVINQESDSFELNYTEKNQISVINIKFDKSRCTELIDYIKSQIDIAKEIELWVLLLDQDTKITKKTIPIDKLDYNVLKEYFVYDFGEYPRCLTITNT